MRNLSLSILSLVLLGGLASCTKNVDPSSEAYTRNDNEIKNYVTQNNLKGTSSKTGLYYVITAPQSTTVKQATVGEEVEFTYKATNMVTGQFVDSSAKGSPVYYPLGIRAIPPGLEEGIGYMREGEKAILLVPSYLAYDSQSATNLPAYSVIRYDITLNRSRSEDQQIDEYIARNKLVVTEKTPSGLRFIKTTDNPNGVSPAPGQTLSGKYKGRLLRATSAFDSTSTSNYDFALGQNVKGFDEGFAKLKTGEKAIIIFPSSSGYGMQGRIKGNNYVITPYAPLRFDIELVDVK